MKEDLKRINLGIGGIFVCREPVIVTTVLGSCVSVCLFDEKNKIAGINHYMLPKVNQNRQGEVGRFGQTSIPALLAQMLRQGAQKSSMTAKIFGGAKMLSQFSSFSGISEGNIEVAQESMRENRIKVVATDTGGNRGRKIEFNTETGRVFVRQVGERQSL
jgi:chemotaxis protein CheD